MSLRIVGAGLGRTGTLSLKVALERLLGEPCYHMMELFTHPEHISFWHSAATGTMPDWHEVLRGYGAAVDWPAASFWPEIRAAFPDAIVLLSLRDAESWWQSAHETIFPTSQRQQNTAWLEMVNAMFATRFTDKLEDREACIAAFEQHNARVRKEVPPDRLVEWRAADGWEPLCNALELPVPDEPFPRVNTREEFLSRVQAS